MSRTCKRAVYTKEETLCVVKQYVQVKISPDFAVLFESKKKFPRTD